ncbi:CYTH and CHAD domain-containing protein [Pseudonocardia bannensis]|uniref:CYTH and CHAD domain-containing protein n=1 Tax=Pseudonocardia bannensis TaxID=630973 RepID=A0A848DKI7_9PSEU|nr:CYTH and CHAD domain-containing protein [Pseudonocardia bannensis]NMH93202.1 CYTH and CHAD domain-containing protein [Pseudonocardia bannensis]
MADTANTTATGPAITYRGPAAAGSPRLAGLPGVKTVATEPPQVLETERWDTDDLRLATAGIELVLHRDDTSAQWRLRLPDGDDTELLRVPAVLPDVEGVTPDGPPAGFDELLRGVRRDRPVRPVGRIRIVRVTTRLLGGAGRLLAEVVQDEVTVATLGRSTSLDTWGEIGVRRAGGDDALLDELRERARAIGAVPAAPGADGALDRALRPAPARRRRTGKKGSAGAVLMDYIGAQADRIAEQDLRARRDEPDAVHQLRVGARRLRSAVQAYRPLVERSRARWLIGELRWLGRALAPARDAEVLRERITDRLDRTDPDLVLGPVRARVARHFARGEAEARAAVLAELDGERYATLRVAIDELLADPPLTRKAARPAAKELPRLASRSARKMERAVREAFEADAPNRDAAIHTVRKRGKRLRYATEVARPAVGAEAKRFGRGLKGMQKALGEHQDTVVSRGALRDLGAQAHAAGENGFAFGLLYGRDEAVAHRIETDLPELWRSAWAKKNRRWLR